METNRAAAASALRAACSQGAFKAAIEAVQLFLPGCPLVGCLRFLQVRLLVRHRLVKHCLVWCRTHTRKPHVVFKPWKWCGMDLSHMHVGCLCSAGRAAGTERWRPILNLSPAQ